MPKCSLTAYPCWMGTPIPVARFCKLLGRRWWLAGVPLQPLATVTTVVVPSDSFSLPFFVPVVCPLVSILLDGVYIVYFFLFFVLCFRFAWLPCWLACLFLILRFLDGLGIRCRFTVVDGENGMDGRANAGRR